MTITEILKDKIDICGASGARALAGEADAEEYRNRLFDVLDVMKRASPDEIRAAGYPDNIRNTLLMDRHLIEDTVTGEIDQLSLLNTAVTYIACRAEGLPEHSAVYMDRVTDLRKLIERVYETDAMRFCGSDGC